MFAFTVDRTGDNLPCTQESDWQFLETLEGAKFAWGEENFGEVYSALAAAGFYLFEGELQPLPGADQKARRRRPERSGQ